MSEFKKGDKVRIIRGPLHYVGREGIVRMPAVNGAMIQFEDGRGTLVRDVNLEKIK